MLKGYHISLLALLFIFTGALVLCVVTWRYRDRIILREPNSQPRLVERIASVIPEQSIAFRRQLTLNHVYSPFFSTKSRR